MKACILLGTRPEIIKMSPLIRACESLGIDYYILHTGQHYSYEMDRQFFLDLELPKPKYNLDVGGRPYRKQVGMMIRQIMDVLSKDRPDIVFVQGDTNSVLAGALAANKLGIPIGHHEAGLRSHDLTMLEETNRIITDHISDFLFAPTKDAKKNLEEEGIDMSKTWLTGNTVVDAVKENLKISEKKAEPLKKLGLKKGGYILATAHRAENVDVQKRLRGIIGGLGLVFEKTGLEVIYPIHPRAKARLEEFKIDLPDGIRLIEPQGYLDFLQLEANAKLIITDSGGLQEEACILKVPCVTTRDNTERPETVDAGINVLSGTVPEKILSCAKDMLENHRRWTNPFGDGHAGKRIIETWLKESSKS
ncbi:UDP-N-acetylglucosamine 2-epimerase (non-hydrolyzing) [Candidatus Woesearchaeota archaeon]|nr:UDP-N-acetylglucosamine 2-epimerase (non-hydrolyzing) [Candidatus Woesearchaeota archaeon]